MVKCDVIPAVATLTATDNCDNDVTIGFNENITTGSCTDTYTITRIWTATDDCGNVETQSKIITIQDNTNPVLAGIPADVMVECDAIPTAVTPMVMDNCDMDVTISLSESSQTGACSGAFLLTHTWTATDNCGKANVQMQTITVEDTTNLVLSGVPTDVMVECNVVPTPATPMASDNCDNDVAISYNEVRTDSSCDDNYTLTCTWTAMDDCGNTDVQMQTITIEDTTNPVLTGLPVDVMVECDNILSPVDLTAMDNCDPNLAYRFQNQQHPVFVQTNTQSPIPGRRWIIVETPIYKLKQS